MLDDLAMIHRRDSLDLLGHASKAWQGLEKPVSVSPEWAAGRQINHVLLVGSGRSLALARTIASWPGLVVPLVTITGAQEELPAYAGKNSLIIGLSDEGWPEGARKLMDDARQRQALAVELDGRDWRMFKALCCLLWAAGVASVPAVTEAEWQRLARRLRSSVADWVADVPTRLNPAKGIALDMVGKPVVVYGGALMTPVAQLWRSDLNRYAKHMAWCEIYPDADWAEPVGWRGQPVAKPFSVVELRSDQESLNTRDWLERYNRFLSGSRPAPVVVQYAGDIASQCLYAASLSEFVAIYLALLSGADPAPSAIMEKFRT